MRTLFAVLLLALPLGAQTPYLVKDINTTYSHERQSSTPTSFTAQGDRVYFVATTEATGLELWSTDGTTASMVSDILPGEASSSPSSLRGGLGSLLLNARDVNHGVELWTTDGTAANTHMLVDINPGPNSSDPSIGIQHGNRWLFAADDGTHGRELWITDGTANGTRLVKDLEPGTTSSSPRAFAIMGDALYFIAGSSLWKTDGTEAGTTTIATPITARNLTAAGGRLYFEALTATTNWELWTSDGTQAGTRMLPEINPGGSPAFSSQFSSSTFNVLGNRVLFIANDGVHGRELWISDGTDAGTHILLDMMPGATGAFDNNGLFIVLFGDRAYFAGQDAEHGSELWSTDGTSAGTTLTLDVRPGKEGSGAGPFGIVNGKIIFIAYTGVSQLWVTDGTASGSHALTAIGAPFDFYGYARVANNRLYFTGETALTGREPWVSDGSDAGTRMIANLAEDGAPSSSPSLLTATDGLLFFNATEGLVAPSNIAEASLWRSDGTAAGTFKLLETGQHPPDLIAAGSHVFFSFSNSYGHWMMSDGTVAGTRTADEFRRRFDGQEMYALHPFRDALYVAIGDSYGTTLWKTTPAPFHPGTFLGSQNPINLIEAAGRKMFYATAPAGIYDRGLWVTDGTPDGTYAVIPDLEASDNSLSPMASANGMAFFLMAKEEDNVTKLWKSDGTLDGTVPVKAISNPSSQIEIDSAGRRIFFLTYDALWTSDGTEAGTIELAKVELLSLGYEDQMKPVGDRVVFLQFDHETNKYTLWGSDGTPEGTKALMPDVERTIADSVDGVLYFAGHDDAHGREVWTTDGTPAGTKMLVDLNVGPADSSPRQFTKMRDTLYFTAYTKATGAELWALPLTASSATIGDAHAGESAQTLRFTVTLSHASQSAVTVNFSTSDDTARAGQDYEAASGTLTFAPGETTKTIDVHLLGDTAPENNETFFVTLSNAARAAGLIVDDDASADLAAALSLSGDSFGVNTTVRITNHGPRAATEVEIDYTSAPSSYSQTWYTCDIPQIANGEFADSFAPDQGGSGQTFHGAKVRARQTDPNQANNVVSWTASQGNDLVMDATFLTPGTTANVAAEIKPYYDVIPDSTDRSVLSFSDVTTSAGAARFTVTALKPGTAEIIVGAYHSRLTVNVVPTGTTPRWPNGVQFDTDFTAITVHRPVKLTVKRLSTAPLAGAKATGNVVVTANGQELARFSITGKDELEVPLYFRWLGSVPYRIAYEGDANFLPVTLDRSVYVYPGTPTITGKLQRVPGQANAYQLKLNVGGAPGASPTGSVQLFRGSTPIRTLTLAPSAGGTSTAETTLTDFAGDDVSVHVSYSGDSLYNAQSQEIRFIAPRRRNVRP